MDEDDNQIFRRSFDEHPTQSQDRMATAITPTLSISLMPWEMLVAVPMFFRWLDGFDNLRRNGTWRLADEQERALSTYHIPL